MALAGVFALSAPFAAFAGGGTPAKPSLVPAATRVDGPKAGTYVSPALLEQARAHGNQRLRVIIQASGGTNAATSAFARNGGADGGKVAKRLSLVDGVAVELKAKWIARLARIPGLVITADAPVQATGNARYNNQRWPYVSGIAQLWGSDSEPAPDASTIAIVDSGLDAGNPDFDGRDYPQVNLSSLTPNAQGDGDGHGTFVAGIAADGQPNYTGASPTSHILPIRVMDDNGTARTSDVIAAAQWILANKDTYDIRVANFSLHSSTATHFFFDPLDRAVEKLWFNGIVVVAAAGNYGTSDGPSGVRYSPGNDPFVVTVGAVDIGSSFGRWDDTVASWSAWGHTEDGFAKPELGAPGQYMVGPVSDGTLAQLRPDHVVAPGYMELSGTSFAAPWSRAPPPRSSR
jgi:serine protease AprX